MRSKRGGKRDGAGRPRTHDDAKPTQFYIDAPTRDEIARLAKERKIPKSEIVTRSVWYATKHLEALDQAIDSDPASHA
jgi:hypothetical protein